jgi:two-component system cell cycle sensor histidine kinase/response regulator CckA
MAGGRIRLESTPGHGSTVRIFLPLDPSAPATPEAVLQPAAVDSARAGAAGGPRAASEAVGTPEAEERSVRAPDVGALIAVVEDEPGVRALVERLLLRGGHRVLTFADGTAALDALADGQVAIDLLITDLVMPGPNGIEVARRVRRARPDLPVVLMSGYAADALRAEKIDEASLDLLSKPFSAGELLERVAAVLADGGRPGV